MPESAFEIIAHTHYQLFTAFSIFIGLLVRISWPPNLVPEAVSGYLDRYIPSVKWHQGILDDLRRHLGNGACSRLSGWPLVQAFCPEIQIEAEALGDVSLVEPAVPTLSFILL